MVGKNEAIGNIRYAFLFIAALHAVSLVLALTIHSKQTVSC